MTPVDTLSDENADSVLCAALLSGLNYEAAAELSGCSRSTVARRMREPGFRARLDQVRAEALARVADRLSAEAIESVSTLASIRSNPNTPATVQVRAATAILEAALKYRATIELEVRLSAIEGQLKMRRN
jgi:hypothetical protein